MPNTLRSAIGIVLLVLALGGVSCDAFYSAWQSSHDDNPVRVIQ